MHRLRGAWKKLRGLFEDSIRQQVTRTGLVYTAAILLTGLAAFASANNLLFLILAAMLSTLLVSGFISRLSLAGLELELLHPEHVSARRRTPARVRLHNEKNWIPSFSIHLKGAEGSSLDSAIYFPVIPGKAVLEHVVELRFARRGTHRENAFQLSTRFPFGFTERHAIVTLRSDILVYPCLDPRPGFEELLASVAGEMESQARGRGSDFYRIRPYEHTESARHVDWKVTAHTGELQVREFAREQERLVVLLLDLDLPPDADDWFERAVDCCAYLLWELSRRGARIRLRTQNFDLQCPEEGDVYSMLKYLALVSPGAGKNSLSLDDPHGYPILLSARPRAALGELAREARVVGRDALPAGAAADGATGG